MTKSKAIKHASSTVSTIYPFGYNWRFSVYSPIYNAWIESSPCEYWMAVHRRRTSIINAAIEALRSDDENDIGQPFDGSNYSGGSWKSYVS